MKRILVSVWCLAVWLPVSASVVAQQPAAPRPKVLAFFTAGGELDHFLFAQQAMRALGASAADRGYAFAATSDWDALNDSSLRDVRVVIWLNDMPHTLAQPGWGSMAPDSATTRGRGSPSSWVAADSARATGHHCPPVSTLTTASTRS